MRSPAKQDGQRRLPGRLTARQVDVVLGALVLTAMFTGLGSFALDDRWNGWVITVHGIAAFLLVLLVPAKLRGSVRAGLRRGRPSRWLSVAFGFGVLGAVALGLLHSTGAWYGVGAWSALWTHEALGLALLPLLAWHWWSRPARPRLRDLDRRALVRAGVLGSVAAAVYATQRPLAGFVGLAGADRRHTGSHEIASHDPARMPTVIWFNDTRPRDTDASTWELRIQGRRVAIDELWDRARPVVATLDCTGGWYSTQAWDAVPLDELVFAPTEQTIRVRSATGYARLVPVDSLADVHLAVGYEGQPLRPGHGAPVRLVVPGRRGPEWVKWVTEITDDARPSWLQPPLPLT